MELKDVILSTLAEMETTVEEVKTSVQQPLHVNTQDNDTPPLTPIKNIENIQETQEALVSDETKFLESVRERLLVLFEGFQSPNNKEIESKVDLTLNFLEYLLATIDTRINALEGKTK